jgi:hypothetical protein
MAAPHPLPPVVDGPITELSTQVYVDNVLPDAAVTVYNDAAGTSQVGTITSKNPGGIWVPLTTKLSSPQLITARQLYAGPDPKLKSLVSGKSDPSNVPVPVESVPNPLPSPVFISGLSNCMDFILMDALIPGATLVVTLEGTATKLVDAPVTQPTQWFQLTPMKLTAGQHLSAVQSASGFKSSQPTRSQPLASAPNHLPPPVITPPLVACQTSIQFVGMYPSADVVTQQFSPAIDGFTTAPSESFWSGLWPLSPGLLTAYQYLPCTSANGGVQKITSPTAKFTVGPPQPTVPNVTYPPCVDVRQLTVSNLIPGEILTLERVVTPTGGGTPEVTPLGSQGVSGTAIPATITVNLPKDFQPTDPAGTVSIRLATMLCDVSSPGYKDVAIGNVGGPFKATVQAPLYDCARFVRILGAHPGSLIQVFSGSTSDPRCNAVVATTPDFVIKLWTPLVTGEQIFVRQMGCGANGTSTPPVTVLKLKALPAPSIVTPVRPSAPEVQVTGVCPGAQVYLYVDNVLRSNVDALDSSVSIPAGAPPLVGQQTLQVVQTLCSETSMTAAGGGGGAVVTLGHLTPAAHPPNPVRGEALSLVISATDTVTGKVVNGLPVTLAASFNLVTKTPVGPSVSGVTGSSITWVPTIPSAALIIGTPAYEDAELVNFVVPPPAKIWCNVTGPASAIVFGSGFPDNTCTVTVIGEGLIPTKSYTGDITKGIPVRISCDNPLGGQYWTINVQSIGGGPMISGRCNCGNQP